MANYTKTTIGKESRIELHEKLSLTGAEISLSFHDGYLLVMNNRVNMTHTSQAVR